MLKPHARPLGQLWMVWCDRIGPSIRTTLPAAYRAWQCRARWTR